jgi:nucleotide-binding universal stress UspA family protein
VVVHHAETAATPDRRSVVVGFDGSDSARAAVRWAAAQAAERGAPLCLVHGFAIPITPFGAPLDDFYSGLRAGAERLLADAMSTATEVTAGAAGLDIRRLAVDDAPSRALLDAARQAQLLVVGTRGRGGFAELVLGSTAHQCALHAACPVAVIPA